jgi:N-acyl-D-aspartate/D-glutamate deacylase
VSEPFDIVIKNGRFFDGLGSAAAIRHVGIRGGVVAAVSTAPLSEIGATRVLDAAGDWVMPGFVDVHTHYDAEVLVSPGLCESVRHGTTTVVIGSCSLSTVHVSALDAADLFSRVEALPRAQVLASLEAHKSWTSPASYVQALEASPLGPNVAAFLGHSDVRASVMGLGRATDASVRPSEDEVAKMETALAEALDSGFLGLSTMMAEIDKLDGDRFRSRPLPSTFARRRELAPLYRLLRRRGRVLQSAPSATRPSSLFGFFFASMSAGIRKPLKISLLTALDTKVLPFLARFALRATSVVNRLFGGKLRWQHLPVPFKVYADGIDFIVFEEFGAGCAALHLQEQIARNELFQDVAYRRQFRRECNDRFSPRLWSRDFREMQILGCPDASVVGLSVAEVATRRGLHPADAFLDLLVEHGTTLRWTTTLANDTPGTLDWLSSHPDVQMGFADSGAHLRNMAFYNFPLRLLRRVSLAERAGKPFMSVEHAVHRLTGELAQFFSIDAGTLCVGDRADIVIVDPAGLDESVDQVHQAPLAEFGGIERLVNRNDRAVRATLIAGRVVFEEGAFVAGYGEAFRTGRFLHAGERTQPAAVDGKSEKAA